MMDFSILTLEISNRRAFRRVFESLVMRRVGKRERAGRGGGMKQSIETWWYR